jgi:hypothetical protein
VTEPRKRLVNANIAALYIQQTFGIPISPTTIRSWANRGHITSYEGQYDLNEVDARMRPDPDGVA